MQMHIILQDKSFNESAAVRNNQIYIYNILKKVFQQDENYNVAPKMKTTQKVADMDPDVGRMKNKMIDSKNMKNRC